MDFMLTLNLLTIPKAWGVLREFLTKAAISIFFVFSLFFALFHIEVSNTKIPTWVQRSRFPVKVP